VTSGIRIGTPAVTTRGMKPGDMEQLGELISAVLKRGGDGGVMDRVKARVAELVGAFPVY